VALHFARRIAVEDRKNRFKPYFTTKQQSVEKNNQARGIYADERVAWGRVFGLTFSSSKDDKMQSIADEEYKYALTGHHSQLYGGGYSVFRYDIDKNTLPNTGWVEG